MVALTDTIQTIHKKMKEKEITAGSLLEQSVFRHRSMDAKIRAYTAWVEPSDPGADGKGDEDLDLFGIPFAVQDTFAVQGLPMTCSSKMLQNYVPGYHATVVERILQQGGVFTGKLNSNEFGLLPGSDHSVFGKTQNPWDADGKWKSVSGAAAAVASGQVWFALGTDSVGELRMDAAACGLTAIKPTFPTLSRHGVATAVPSMEHVGIAARNPQDCQQVWRVMVGQDPFDSTVLDDPGVLPDREMDWKEVCVGIPVSFLEAADGISQDAVMQTAEKLVESGARVEKFEMPDLDDARMAAYVLLCAEASSALARYDGVRYGYRNREAGDVLSMYLKTRQEGLNGQTKEKILLGTHFLSTQGYESFYSQAARLRTRIIQHFAHALSRFDCLLMPVEASSESTQKYAALWGACANLAGLPALTFPAGMVESRPVGVQLVGRAMSESLLFAAADKVRMEIDWDRIPSGTGR